LRGCASTARVFHDVPGQGFNLDHVVISAHGIFVIETKTHRKPSPHSTVRVAGDELQIGGFVPDRNPIVQARASARWLAQLLQESTGRAFTVRGVVVFPGWFIEQQSPRSDVWVLEPKALPAFIEAEPACTAQPDVALAAYHLSRYVRASQAA